MVVSRVLVFKAVSLDEVTEGVRVDRREMRSSTEPWGTWALRVSKLRRERQRSLKSHSQQDRENQERLS